VGGALVAREDPRAVRGPATAVRRRDAVAGRAEAHERRLGVLERDRETVGEVGIRSQEGIPALGLPSTLWPWEWRRLLRLANGRSMGIRPSAHVSSRGSILRLFERRVPL
jgi:hypothetical protein